MLSTTRQKNQSCLLAGFMTVCLGVLLPVVLFAQEQPKSPPTAPAQVLPGKPSDLPDWSSELRRKLEVACQAAAANGQNCFDIPLGGKVLDLVPVGEVADAEKSQLRAFWEKILQPEYLPQDPARITWRKLQLTRIAWQPAKAGTKGWGPPKADWVCARWEVAGRPVVAINQTITLQFAGSQRLRYRHPTREEVGLEASSYIVEKQIDKPALLNILISAFRVPWLANSDFVVRWSMAQSPDSLKIRSTKFHLEPEPPAWRDWYDDIAFDLLGEDPQYLTFGFWVPPK